MAVDDDMCKKERMMQNSRIKTISMYSMFIALVFVATYFIRFKMPFGGSGGLVHAGNTPLFAIAMLFGQKKGAVSGAFGMALFDIASEYFVWAPATFIIRGIMGLIIGYIFMKGKENNWSLALMLILAIVISSIEMIFGYMLFDVFMFGDWMAAFLAVIGDTTQLLIGWLGAVPLYLALSKQNTIKEMANA